MLPPRCSLSLSLPEKNIYEKEKKGYGGFFCFFFFSLGFPCPHSLRHPVKALAQTSSLLCAASLNVPVVVLDVVELHAGRDFGRAHAVVQILLVRQDENKGALEVVARDHLP